MRFTHSFLALSFCVLTTLGLQSPVQAQNKEVKISSFAPTKDTIAQVKAFMKAIGKDLSDKEDFGEDQHNRINLNGQTVAVLALTLGMHDEKNDVKSNAGEVFDAAIELADNAESFDDAMASFQKLEKALEVKDLSKRKLSWDESVDIAALMKQVPIVNKSVRRGVDDERRFERTAKKTAQKVVTLAAIAHVSMMNTDYCSDEDDEKEWKKICADMRDACTDVYKALMAKDQKKAQAGNDRVVETCDACHHKFRD